MSNWEAIKSTLIIIIALFLFGSCSYAIYDDSSAAGQARNAAKAQQQRTEHEQDRNEQLKHTPGMEDCTFHDLNGINVVRCPRSSTTTSYQCGKGCFQNNTVVEG